MRIAILTASLLALAACSDPTRPDNTAAMGGAAPMAPPMPVEAYSRDEMAEQGAPSALEFSKSLTAAGPNQGQVGPNGQSQGQQPAQLIAYTYDYTFEVPTGRMQALMDAQKAACQQAGPAKCYILSASASGIGEEGSSGRVQMKAAPDWIKSFQDGLPEALKGFEARVDASTTDAEDLTTQIVDTTARLNSQKTLRDRLQKLLAERPGKLAELLETERALAEVQGGIDATESVLAAMRLRVAMSTLTLNYAPRYSAASESIWRPLGDAFSGIVPNIVGGLAALIDFLSSTFIFLVIAAVAGWFVWRRWRKGRNKVAAAPPGSPGAT